MTKKHFIALADTIRDFQQCAKHGDCEPLTETQIALLAGFCEDQNPRFDRSRWLAYIKGQLGEGLKKGETMKPTKDERITIKGKPFPEMEKHNKLAQEDLELMADQVPHMCSVLNCPGDINRRKLQAAEEMATVLRQVIFESNQLGIEAALGAWEKAKKGGE